jgi:hypothetical protein
MLFSTEKLRLTKSSTFFFVLVMLIIFIMNIPIVAFSYLLDIFVRSALYRPLNDDGQKVQKLIFDGLMNPFTCVNATCYHQMALINLLRGCSILRE